MSISEFKAKCLAVLERVSRTGQQLVITKRGVPIAQVTPPPPAAFGKSMYGYMAGTAEELGDIVAPLGDYDDWVGDRLLAEESEE